MLRNLISNYNFKLIRTITTNRYLLAADNATKFSKSERAEIKNLIDFFVYNDIPDRNLEDEVKQIKIELKDKKERIKLLKTKNESKENVDKAVAELKIVKEKFTEKIGSFINELILKNRTEQSFDKTNFETNIKNFFFYDRAFTIYGGASGIFDLGPVGTSIQNNIINVWRKFFVINDRMHEVDCSILTPEIALKASGHLAKFSDIMVNDSKTNEPFRVDHLLRSEIIKLIKSNKDPKSVKELETVLKKIVNSELTSLESIDEIIMKYSIKSPKTGNSLNYPQPFNLMFKTQFGSNPNNRSYLRPETSQGIFANFKNLLSYNQNKLPLIVAQVGKSFRNEITPKSGLIRQREFLMAEIEHFLDPDLKYKPYEKFSGDAENTKVYLLDEKSQLNSNIRLKIRLRDAVNLKIIKSETLAYYISRVFSFVKHCGIDENKIRFRQHLKNEMAHYANECWDLEIRTSLGWIECVGIADRCDHDLKSHAEHSGANLVCKKVKDKRHIIRDRIIESNNKEYASILNYMFNNFEEFNQQIEEQKNSPNEIKKIKVASYRTVNFNKEEFDHLVNLSNTKNIYIEKETFTPHVIEPSFGIGRIMYCILEHNFKPRLNKTDHYYFMLPFSIAPYKCSIMPIEINESFLKYAKPLIDRLTSELDEKEIKYRVDLDSSKKNIGKGYYNSDICGIPYAITIDKESLKSNVVSIRYIDTTEQIEVKVEEVAQIFENLSKNKTDWKNLLGIHKKIKK